MFCRNCGKEVHEKAVACPGCGVPPKVEKKYCPQCGNATQAAQVMCVKCGTALTAASNTGTGGGSGSPKSKMVAGLLGIFLGCFGAHKFYLGYSSAGAIELVLSLLCGVGLILGPIEGIIYMTKTDEEFDRIYIQGKKAWF